MLNINKLVPGTKIKITRIVRTFLGLMPVENLGILTCYDVINNTIEWTNMIHVKQDDFVLNHHLTVEIID